MNLHLDKDSFEGVIVIDAEHFKVSEILIEKDYWVTFNTKTGSDRLKNQ
ncbi:hypothetical protein [Flavobacterium pectinovorum]|nr:hypothetical protein [Flavobacterium pectinovorum]